MQVRGAEERGDRGWKGEGVGVERGRAGVKGVGREGDK